MMIGLCIVANLQLSALRGYERSQVCSPRQMKVVNRSGECNQFPLSLLPQHLAKLSIPLNFNTMKLFGVIVPLILFYMAVIPPRLPQKGLILDLDADTGISASDSDRVESWDNRITGAAMQSFHRQDEGRPVPGSGRPTLIRNVREINNHNSVLFLKQELVNDHEDATDHLITGSGYTWVAVIKPHTQVGLLKDVSSFFGNLRNGENYEGFWGCFADDNRVWTGSRNGITFGRWDENNPMIIASTPLDTTHFYLLAGRMESGTGTVNIHLYINDLATPKASGKFPVNTKANASKLAIGQERDAVNHPGVESFNGQIARMLIYDRPLNKSEMKEVQRQLQKTYALRLD